MKTVLESLYNDIGKPHALSTPHKLYEAAKTRGIKLRDCVSYLNSKNDYTLHKTTRLNYPRNKIIIGGPKRTLVSDLADLKKLSRYNNNVKYLLILIDGFSRYLKVYPLKNKTGILTASKLREGLEDPDFAGVTHLFSDAGSEYTSSHAKQLYKEKRVKQYSTHNSEFKTSIAERVIRTLKEKIFRYLTYKNTKRYIDVLPQIVNSYNFSNHRTLNTTPHAVHKNFDKDALERLFQRMYTPVKRRKHRLLNPGSSVRIASARRNFVFRKGYEPLNTIESFIIDRIDTSQQEPIYYLKDSSNEPILGRFSRYELVPTCVV